jgi:hypothetical protein
MRVEVILDDNTTFSWSMERGKKAGSYKRPVEFRPMDVRWPVQEITAVLAGDATSVSSWLEEQVTGGSIKDDLLRKMPPDLREEADRYITKKNKTDFLLLAKDAKQEAKNLRSASTRKENTIDKLVEGVAPPLLDADREALQARLQELNMVRGGATQEDYDELKAEVNTFVDAYLAKVTELNAIPVDLKAAEAAGKLGHAVSYAQGHIAMFGEEDCWVCGEGSHAQIVEQLTILQSAQAQLEETTKGFAARAKLEVEVERLKNQMEAKAEELKAMVVVEDHSDERDEIIGKLAADDAARKTWGNAEAQRKEIELDRAKADKLSRVGKALETAGKELLEERKAAFENKVSSFLPDGEEIGVDLDTGRIGLTRSGELHSALSGAEWSRVLLALASAQASSSTPCVLVPEDRAWDRDTLGRVMASLAASPFQVIIMSTVKPDPVEGWSLVDLTA